MSTRKAKVGVVVSINEKNSNEPFPLEDNIIGLSAIITETNFNDRWPYYVEFKPSGAKKASDFAVLSAREFDTTGISIK